MWPSPCKKKRSTNMQIVIPSSGRAGQQPSFSRLTGVGLQVSLAVPAREAASYSKYTPVLSVPDHLKIAGTRQWIIDNATDDVVIMVDDDLAFFQRRTDDPTKLRDITDAELRSGFQHLDAVVGPKCPLGGFASREGANRNTEPYVFDTRILRVLAYHVPTLRKHNIRFDEVTVMEDFHVALRLHEQGLSSIVVNTVAHNQVGGSNAPGGCSQYRTMQVQGDAADLLHRLHPKYVKVVEKETKTAWNGQPRKDVTVYWKRCVEDHRRGQ